MKNLVYIFFVLFIFCVMSGYAQKKVYTVIYDSARKQSIYEGLLSTFDDQKFHKKNFFFNEIFLGQYLPDMKIYKPLVKSLIEANKKTNVSMVIVGGIWWCPDTRDILSKWVVYTDSSDFNNITCIGVDRKKQSPSYPLVNQYHIERVPTIILFKNNEEIGRVVEYGKKGNWEKELTGILRKVIK